MYKPPEKIHYQPAPGPSPSEAEARAAMLYAPLRYRALEIANRCWVPAMVPWRASEDGFATDDVVDWYARFAAGRPGALVVEATGIRDVPSGPLLRIGDDRFLPGLRRVVEAVREASDGQTKLYIQLIDFLGIKRRPPREKFLTRFLKIDAALRTRLGIAGEVPDTEVHEQLLATSDDDLAAILSPRDHEALTMGFRERVTDLDQPHIRDLPQTLPGQFAAAAARARAAGFDGVELHYAHAYTMASMLSALNTRDDGYGGSRENRVRLPLEVYRAVRAEVGEDYVVGCRFLSEDIVEGGSTLDDTRYFGVQFAQAGMDFLSLSRGGRFEDAAQPRIGAAAYPYTGRSGYECMPQHISDEQGPFGRNIAPTAAIRSDIRAAGYETPVAVAGGIHGFAMAEAILQSGEADIIGAARQSLADPDWFAKVRRGDGDSVRVCEYTNYCEGLDLKHKQVTCKLWDREDLDAPGVPLSHDGKRRLVAP